MMHDDIYIRTHITYYVTGFAKIILITKSIATFKHYPDTVTLRIYLITYRWSTLLYRWPLPALSSHESPQQNQTEGALIRQHEVPNSSQHILWLVAWPRATSVAY